MPFQPAVINLVTPKKPTGLTKTLNQDQNNTKCEPSLAKKERKADDHLQTDSDITITREDKQRGECTIYIFAGFQAFQMEVETRELPLMSIIILESK